MTDSSHIDEEKEGRFPKRDRKLLKTEGYLRPKKVAEILDISTGRIYEMVNCGQLKAIRLGKRALRISAASLQKFLESREIKNGETPPSTT